MDSITPAQRSVLMARVHGKNTTPEYVVRRAAHALGLRFRLHRRDLPGSPDLVFPRHCTVIFVHGCFWHRHPGCKRATTPKSNKQFWQVKLKRNVERDASSAQALESLGWRVEVIWECETKDTVSLQRRIKKIFNLSTKR
jgi:DNA mismatch endonuclease, patch repair protein